MYFRQVADFNIDIYIFKGNKTYETSDMSLPSSDSFCLITSHILCSLSVIFLPHFVTGNNCYVVGEVGAKNWRLIQGNLCNCNHLNLGGIVIHEFPTRNGNPSVQQFTHLRSDTSGKL